MQNIFEPLLQKRNIILVTSIFLAIAVASIILMADIIALLILLLIPIVVLTILKPYWGLAFLISLIPLEGFLAAGPVLSFMKFYGIFLVFVSLPLIFFKKIKDVSLNWLPLLYLAFVLWSFMSFFWSSETSLNIAKNFTYLSLFILYLLIIFLPDKNNDTLHIKCFVVGAFLSVILIPIIGKDLITPTARIAGGGLNANDYAATIAIALPLALLWFQTEKNNWMKIIPILFIPIGLIAIAYTKSRTGTLALIPFVIYSFLIFKDQGLIKKFILLALLLTSLFSLMYFAPEGYFERVKALDVESTDRFTHRLDVWVAGWNMFKDNLLLGVGTGNFQFFSNHYAETFLREGALVAHNAIISIAGELGIIGVLIFLILIIRHAKISLLLYNDSNSKIIAAGLIAAFSAYIIASMGLTWEYRKVLPLILGSIILLSRKEKNGIK